MFKFTKMQGLGNDFIIVNSYDKPFNLNSSNIKGLSHRKFGIGFDQLLLVEKPTITKADFKYRIFNADGAEVEHCGNGARCFARYVYDKKITTKKNLIIQTKNRQIKTQLHNDLTVSVFMGHPITNPKLVPFLGQSVEKKSYLINIKGNDRSISVVSMGNPHAVMFVEELDSYKVVHEAQEIQSLSCFPDSVNVNYVEVINKGQIKIRTYERGVGETLACGTGACASMFCAYLLGLSDDNVKVITKGGELFLSYKDKELVMRGSASYVFDGEILDQHLSLL